MKYKRFENESDDELIYRITGDKEQIGSWKDVADILNELLGTDYGESTFRKKRQIFDKMMAANQSKFSDNEAQLEEIKEERQRLEKEKVKVRDERNEYRRLIREQARKESYKDQIIRAIKEHQEKPLDYDKMKQFTGVLKSDNDLICSFTDVHTGIQISNFVNEFNTNILKNRINQYLDKILEVQLRHGSENCYIILSELISGIIHSTLRIENNQNLIEQFLTIMDYLTQFLSELSYRFNTVNVFVCEGNHSRIVAKKDDSLTGENMDMLAIPFLSASLQNFDNINFYNNNIETSIATFRVRNKLIAASHGDKDNPDTVVQKFTMFLGEKPDIIYLGHRHTNGLTTAYDVKVIESGCISGSDQLCMDRRLRNKPEQTISVITKDGLECLYNVVLN